MLDYGTSGGTPAYSCTLPNIVKLKQSKHCCGSVKSARRAAHALQGAACEWIKEYTVKWQSVICTVYAFANNFINQNLH